MLQRFLLKVCHHILHMLSKIFWFCTMQHYTLLSRTRRMIPIGDNSRNNIFIAILS